MTDEEILELIKLAAASYNKSADAKLADQITMETDLQELLQFDSLDSTELLFEIERRLGRKISGIEEDFNDFRVTTLTELIRAS
jgi:acyl carrier protein